MVPSQFPARDATERLNGCVEVMDAATHSSNLSPPSPVVGAAPPSLCFRYFMLSLHLLLLLVAAFSYPEILRSDLIMSHYQLGWNNLRPERKISWRRWTWISPNDGATHLCAPRLIQLEDQQKVPVSWSRSAGCVLISISLKSFLSCSAEPLGSDRHRAARQIKASYKRSAQRNDLPR